jgi:TPR repeat protein
MTVRFFRRWFHRSGKPPLPAARIQNCADDSSEAQFGKGLRCACGQGTAQDYEQAAHWYAQAAEQDHSLAQFNLAVMYAQGQGVARDVAKSLLWMTRSAELGDAGAQYKLGVQQHLAYKSDLGEAGAEKRIEALKWVQLSAAQGYGGAEEACEFVALSMTWEEVSEGGRRASAFGARGKAGEIGF